MRFNTLWSRNCACPLPRSSGRTWPSKGSIRHLLLTVSAVSLIVLATGCATPKVQPADPQLLFKSDLLSFLGDGVTTREEVVLKLGIPSAQMEGEKILMYQLNVDETGKWRLVAPRWNPGTGLRAWSEGTCSLVLVFGENGVLQKHSLVITQ